MDNSPILWHITSYMESEHIEKLILPTIWPIVSSFASDLNWWYHRVQVLVGKNLQSRDGDELYNSSWKDVYWRISSNENIFSSTLCIKIGLEIGYDITSLGDRPLSEAISTSNIEAAILLLDNGAKRIEYNNSQVIFPILQGNYSREVYRLLFSRCIDYTILTRENNLSHILKLVSSYENLVAIEEVMKYDVDPSEALFVYLRKEPDQSVEVLRLLLKSERARPNLALSCVIRRDNTEAFSVLLRDKRIRIGHLDDREFFSSPNCLKMWREHIAREDLD